MIYDKLPYMLYTNDQNFNFPKMAREYGRNMEQPFIINVKLLQLVGGKMCGHHFYVTCFKMSKHIHFMIISNE
jgi:hypothetical protein